MACSPGLANQPDHGLENELNTTADRPNPARFSLSDLASPVSRSSAVVGLPAGVDDPQVLTPRAHGIAVQLRHRSRNLHHVIQIVNNPR